MNGAYQVALASVHRAHGAASTALRAMETTGDARKAELLRVVRDLERLADSLTNDMMEAAE